MHLAVKSVEVLKSTRPVRALLLKGANRNPKCNNGKTPTDMISDHMPEGIRLDLEQILVIILNTSLFSFRCNLHIVSAS